MNIAIVGNGRMGRTLDAVCARRDDVRVIGHVGRGGCESLDALDGLDAALDFSAPESLSMLLSGAVRRRIPLVIGTTGMSGAQGEAIRAASRRIPIVWSANFSVGVTVLVRLARLAAQALGREFDMEIVETHHNQKADAPSGTAKLIFKHVLPNIIGPILVTAVLDIGTMMMELAALSFLGLGAKAPTAEWGSMMSDTRSLMTTSPWITFSPGIAIFVSVMIFNLLGDTLRDYADPKSRRR